MARAFLLPHNTRTTTKPFAYPFCNMDTTSTPAVLGTRSDNPAVDTSIVSNAAGKPAAVVAKRPASDEAPAAGDAENAGSMMSPGGKKKKSRRGGKNKKKGRRGSAASQESVDSAVLAAVSAFTGLGAISSWADEAATPDVKAVEIAKAAQEASAKIKADTAACEGETGAPAPGRPKSRRARRRLRLAAKKAVLRARTAAAAEVAADFEAAEAGDSNEATLQAAPTEEGPAPMNAVPVVEAAIAIPESPFAAAPASGEAEVADVDMVAADVAHILADAPQQDTAFEVAAEIAPVEAAPVEESAAPVEEAAAATESVQLVVEEEQAESDISEADAAPSSALAAAFAAVEEVAIESQDVDEFPMADDDAEIDSASQAAEANGTAPLTASPLVQPRSVPATMATPSVDVEARVLGRVSCRIVGVETRALGCFNKHTVYMVTREASGKAPVERRYSAFRHLYKEISREHPSFKGSFRFPGKRTFAMRDSVVADRHARLQAFLDTILTNREICESRVFEAFMADDVEGFNFAEL